MNRLALTTALQCAAALQLGIATLNLFLVPLLRWQDELARMPLLLREVFHVHAWFISLTLALFAVLTWRFANDMTGAANLLAHWLAAGIGSFWAIRTVLQVTYYSSSHWRGQPARTVAHIVLLLVYGGLAAAYLFAAFSLRGE
jgi:hypothetical protein